MCVRHTYIAFVVLHCYIFESQQINYGSLNHHNDYDKFMQHEIKKAEEFFQADLGKGLEDIYLRKSNPDIKESLDNFQMKRRLTHFTFPPNADVKNKVMVHEIDRLTASDTVQAEPPILENPKEYTEDHSEEEEDLIYKHPAMFNLMQSQTALMEKVIRVLEEELKLTLPRTFDKDFEDILGVNETPSSTVRDWRNYRHTEAPKNLTIISTVDELKMREKLKNDPLVKRIIAMAKLKRKQYFEKLRTFKPNP